MKKVIKTILLENDNWFWTGLEDFCKSIDPNFEKFCPQIRDAWFVPMTSLHFSMNLSQPEVKDIIVMSAFEGNAAGTSGEGWQDQKQIEFYIPLIREVLRFREAMEYGGLTFHVVYGGVSSFMKALQDGKLGETTHQELSLILRQQDNITIKLYNSDTFELIDTIQGKSE